MFRSSRSRFAILLLFVMALLAPWSTPAEAADVEESYWSLALPTWDWGADFWSAVGRLWLDAAVYRNGSRSLEAAESGCSVDPSGLCGGGAGGAATATSDAGCSADPNGGCRE
jgi:hypothetical protein